MKNVKLYFFLTILSVGVLVSGCKKDEEDPKNTITITIDEPVNGETITDCSEVHVHIDIVASDENHGIEILLHPEGDVSDKILDVDMHAHDKEVRFDQEVDLCSYPAGTCFHLEVEACADHDCESKETADVEFCLQ